MRLPALEIQGLNLPGIMMAQQQYKLGEAQLAKYGREAEKDKLTTGLRAGAVSGDKDMLNTLAAIDPASAKAILEFTESASEQEREKFLRDARIVTQGLRDLGPNPTPVQMQQFMAQLRQGGVSETSFPFMRQDDIANVAAQPERLQRMMPQLAAAVEQMQKRARAYETEPRETRERKVGDQIVTEEYDPTAGKWSEISEGPRWSPTQTEVVGRTPGDISLMTPAQRGKQVQDLQNQRIALINFMKASDRLIENLEEGGAEAISTVGNISRFINSVGKQISAAGRVFLGNEKGPSEQDIKTWRDDIDWMGSVAENSASLQSKIVSLAYGLALVKNGARPTDEDVRNMLTVIAGSSGSPQQMAAAVKSAMGEALDNYATRHLEITGEAYDVAGALEKHGLLYKKYKAGSGAIKKPLTELTNDELLNLPLTEDNSDAWLEEFKRRGL